MPKTTEELAIELNCSQRQVINYKAAVEAHLGHSITFRQGKKHFYHDKYLPLIQMYAKGEPLPITERIEPIEPNPFTLEEQRSSAAGSIVLHTSKLPAPIAVEAVPVKLKSVDTTEIDTVTEKNWERTSSFKDYIRAQVLADAESFGEELASEVKHVVSQKVARAYREVIRQ